MAAVHLICGKICVGKSTFAHTLANEKSAVILSCDEIMTLFPQPEQLPFPQLHWSANSFKIQIKHVKSSPTIPWWIQVTFH